MVVLCHTGPCMTGEAFKIHASHLFIREIRRCDSARLHDHWVARVLLCPAGLEGWMWLDMLPTGSLLASTQYT